MGRDGGGVGMGRDGGERDGCSVACVILMVAEIGSGCW